MRKITILTLVLTMMLGFNANAGKKKGKKPTGFAGTITYKITYEGREITGEEEAQMPTQQISYYTADKAMDKIVMPMGFYKTIMDYSTNTVTVIIDMMGQSMYGSFSKDSIDTDKPAITVNKLDETKTIAGYKCTKAEIIAIVDGKESKTVVFYTDEIKAIHPDEDFKEIDGVILEKQTIIGEGEEELTMIMTATVVKKGKIKSIEFLQPSGATELSKEQLMQMSGK